MSRILIIEDNENQRIAVTDRLESEGYEVVYAEDSLSGEEALKKGDFDLALVDIMMPGHSGFDLLNRYRSKGGVAPVIFLTAKTSIADKVSGLRLGADDYITKPFDFSELTARIDALLRRTRPVMKDDLTESKTEESIEEQSLHLDDMTFGPFTLIFKKMRLLKNGENVPLSLMEFKLLVYLVTHQDVLVKTETLMDIVWGYDADIAPGTVYTHISWLRKKLKNEENKSGYIQTVRNIGYIFSLQQA
jgi:DNA-binding response OmpR family regulator